MSIKIKVDKELDELTIEIANIKNIRKAQLSLSVDAGLYAIVGENATGKSTLMLALSQLVRGSSLSQLDEIDFGNDSYAITKRIDLLM